MGSIPIGWFHSKAQQEEEELVTKGQIIQLYPIIIPKNTSGPFGPVNQSANGLHLLNSISQDRGGGSLLLGSTTARVMVRINREDSPWIPFSFIANSGDAQVFAATIGKIWFNVITPDAANPIIFVAVSNCGIGCTGAGNTVGSYSVPAGAQGPVYSSAHAPDGATPRAFSRIQLPPAGNPNAISSPSGSAGRVIAANKR